MVVQSHHRSPFYLPTSLHTTDWQGDTHDLVRDFVEEEYAPFPVGLHDDVFDMFARIAEPDLTLEWPKPERKRPEVEPVHDQLAWMA